MIKSEMLPVRDRILKAIEDLPENRQRRGKYPKVPGVHNTVIKRLFDGDSLPAAENLKKISNATGLPIDFFLKGEESKPATAGFISDHCEVQPLESLETILLFEVLEAVEGAIIEKRQKLTLRQQARLVTLVYDHCRREKEQPCHHLVDKYLLLTD
jgi:transcriptional regulator with XRE-family HTH domain